MTDVRWTINGRQKRIEERAGDFVIVSWRVNGKEKFAVEPASAEPPVIYAMADSYAAAREAMVDLIERQNARMAEVVRELAERRH